MDIAKIEFRDNLRSVDFLAPVDTHIGKWQAESGRLDHDRHVIPILEKIMPIDRDVIDCGAFNGDHTICYSESIDKRGTVLAVEAGRSAFECLKTNAGRFKHRNVIPIRAAIWSKIADRFSWKAAPNVGASHVQGDGQGDIDAWTIDALVRSFDLRPGFIKLDVEGCETHAILGAGWTLEHFKPILFVEVNHSALSRQGSTSVELLAMISARGYDLEYVPAGARTDDPQYDIICRPTP